MNELDQSLEDRQAGFLADMAALNIKWGIGLGIATVDLKERMLQQINQNNEENSKEEIPEVKS